MSSFALHFLIGVVGLTTGWGVRSACKHTGLIPHWRWQVPLAIALVCLEAFAAAAIEPLFHNDHAPAHVEHAGE